MISIRPVLIYFYELFYRPLLKLRRFRWIRAIQTGNFRNGYLALGERNIYFIPSRWVTADWGQSDFIVDFAKEKEFPFEDNSQKFIYSAHMIEHITTKRFPGFLSQVYRILRPGGTVRFETPDCKKIVEEYKNGNIDFFSEFVESNRPWFEKLGLSKEYHSPHIAFLGLISCYNIEGQGHVPVFVSKTEFDKRINEMELDDFLDWTVSLQTQEQLISGGHVNPLYPEKLQLILDRAGFKNISLKSNRVSGVQGLNLRGIERRHRSHISFYMEAQK